VREVPLEKFSMIGKTLGHYRFVEKLGSGAIGSPARFGLSIVRMQLNSLSTFQGVHHHA
jgi:hypothetical protein